ncbi:MAG TPA: VOC family protein [Micropepsaceae bacterium]|nr:VOC family protein [Micropepsaceae bacterium]
MEAVISSLVSRFEKGSLSRRDLVRSLALLAAGAGMPTIAAAQANIDFRDAGIDHVSVRVADLDRSTKFYQNMFGFKVVSEDKAQHIVRLGNAKVLVSLNDSKPAGTIDHFSIGVPRFDAKTDAGYFTRRGAIPLQGDYAGFHIKDPDGVNVQISKR